MIILKKKKFLRRGILLSEFFIYRYGKKHILNIYLYVIDLEKQAVVFINSIYQNYYDGAHKEKNKLPQNFWFYHNADLYALIFMFYHYTKQFTFNKSKKLILNKVKDKKGFLNLKYYNKLKTKIDILNELSLKYLKGRYIYGSKREPYDYIYHKIEHADSYRYLKERYYSYKKNI